MQGQTVGSFRMGLKTLVEAMSRNIKDTIRFRFFRVYPNLTLTQHQGHHQVRHVASWPATESLCMCC
jgi:hypothetical protein